ncbi:MAG: response regulator [Polyangiaceae bacterium]|nr:response regulator [Polyangiaceae bacterium]
MDSTTHRAASQVGGARADFVAELGRKVGELRRVLAAVGDPRTAAGARDELRRRVHALCSAARIHKLEAVAAALAAAEARLAEGALTGTGARDLEALDAAFGALVGLAWGEERARPSAPSAPSTVLVVGPASLAAAVVGGGGDAVECERSEHAEGALALARALAPDVVVLDADVAGTEALAEALADDPLTEPVPIVVLGRFAQPESAARWLAQGALRVLPKPSSPDALWEACASATSAVRRGARAEALGALSVDDLAARLAEELRRGLSDAVSTDARGRKVDLGEGHEVQAALWSAIARVREIVTVRSAGVVRFADHGPAGAIALGSFAPDARMPGARGGATPDVDARLDGVTAIVADDDPAVRWFLAGVLGAAHATVHEAEDGERALGLAYRTRPDLVITDVLMPNLDGFALCQALKRDVELRDVPVILLSWKEDLLQRVRELGADADGYLRKEASGAVALARVREVLRARTSAEARLRAGGEVRGRLDGLTVATLLRMTARHHADATVTVRDATFLYELELRDGAPVRATRTAADGSFDRGRDALAAALGARAGRFVVAPSTSPVRRELDGGLAEQLDPIVARASAAQRLLSSTSLMDVARVSLAEARFAPYLAASPPIARAIAEKLAAGASPRQLLLRAGVSARTLEDLLCDAAAHGVVTSIHDASGDELLDARAAAELEAIVTGQCAAVAPRRPRVEIDHAAVLTPGPRPADLATSAPRTPTPAPSAADSAVDALLIEPIEPLFPALAAADGELATEQPSSAPLASATAAPEEGERAVDHVITPSAAPQAGPTTELAPRAPTPTPAALALPSVTVRAEDVVPTAAPPRDVDASAPGDATPSDEAPADAVPPRRRRGWLAPTAAVTVAGACAALLLARSITPVAPVAPSSTEQARATQPAPMEPARAEPARVEPAAQSASASAPLPATSAPAVVAEAPFEDLPLPPGASVPEGHGMIEVVAGKRDHVSVDRRDLGRGPRVTAALPPGSHDVRARRKGEEQPMVVLVRPGRRTRVDLRAPWRR